MHNITQPRPAGFLFYQSLPNKTTLYCNCKGWQRLSPIRHGKYCYLAEIATATQPIMGV